MQRGLRGLEERFPIGCKYSNEIAGVMARLFAGPQKINRALATPRRPLNNAMGKVRRLFVTRIGTRHVTGRGLGKTLYAGNVA